MTRPEFHCSLYSLYNEEWEDIEYINGKYELSKLSFPIDESIEVDLMDFKECLRKFESIGKLIDGTVFTKISMDLVQLEPIENNENTFLETSRKSIMTYDITHGRVYHVTCSVCEAMMDLNENTAWMKDMLENGWTKQKDPCYGVNIEGVCCCGKCEFICCWDLLHYEQ